MIIKAVKYALKNDWKQIRSDWRQYKTLRTLCRQLYVDMQNAHNAISVRLHEGQDASSVCACVKYKLIYLSSVSNDYENRMAVPVMYNCRRFQVLGNEFPCSLQTCPYQKQNNEYVERYHVYNGAVEQRNKFWAEKFAHIK